MRERTSKPPCDPGGRSNSQKAVEAELQAVRSRELELKRLRGEISCAECRRVKLKCDRKVPCTTCKRKGFESICPIGTSIDGPSTSASTSSEERDVFAETSSLSAAKEKLRAMSLRISVLEDALHAEYSTHRGHTPTWPPGASSIDDVKQTRNVVQLLRPVHPLLSPDLLRIKNDVDAVILANDEADNDVGMLKSFGTLSISNETTQRFLGASASDELVLMETFVDKNEDVPRIDNQPDLSPSLSPEILQASKLWPFSPSYLASSSLASQLVQHLPSLGRATALIEAFFTNLAWFCSPVERDQVVTELLPFFYPRMSSARTDCKTPLEEVAADRPHDLALLFALFSFGAAADLTLPLDNTEAHHYNVLARSALSLRNIFNGGSLTGCQAVCMLAVLQSCSGKPEHQEDGWTMMSLGLSLASSIGLHRDPAGWNFDEKLCYKRRAMFWEIYSMGLWNSLDTGRPCLFASDVVDTKIPVDRKQIIEADGTVVYGVRDWSLRFVRDVLVHISRTLCSVHPVKYKEILELDRKVRDFETHPHLLRPGPNNCLGFEHELQRFHPVVTACEKEWALLSLHRYFFARAMLEHSDNPLRSPFAPSVLSAYKSACAYSRIVRFCLEHISPILFRTWPTFSHAISSMIILATISQKGKAISFYASAFHELELALQMFQKASELPLVAKVLPLLYRLRDQAAESIAANHGDPGATKELALTLNQGGQNKLEKKGLDILNGGSRLVVHLTDGSAAMKTNESTPSLRHSPGYSSPEYSTPSDTAGSSSEPGHQVPVTSTRGSGSPAEIPVVDDFPGIERDEGALFAENSNHLFFTEGGLADPKGKTFANSTNFDGHTVNAPHLPSAPFHQRNDGTLDPLVAPDNRGNSDADLWAWLTGESDPNVRDSYLFGDTQTHGLFASSQTVPNPSYDPNADLLGASGVNAVPSGYETTVSFAPLIINDANREEQPIPAQGGEGTDALASTINAAAWNTFLHQNGIPDINSGMDWESIYQTR